MKIIARIILLATGVLLLSHYLPEGYRLLIAKKHPRPPIVFYSCVQKEFLFSRYNDHGVIFVDEKGTNYDRETFEQLLPIDNYLQLLRNDTLPKDIDGVPLIPDKIKRERLSIRIRPEMLDTPIVPLYPLMEAENGRVRLEMPNDFMRLKYRVEFVIAAGNKVDSVKSDKFTRVFVKAGFAFPPRIVAGNATTLKPYDEGYFLVDKTGVTYQLRMIRGEPDLKRISELVPLSSKEQWETLHPKFIHVQEGETHEIRAFLISEQNQPFLVVGKDYKLVPIPLEHYDPSQMNLVIRGDLLNRLVTAVTEDSFEAIALNRNYEVLRRYHEELPTLNFTIASRIRSVIFPFTLSFEDNSTNYYGFFFEYGSPAAFALNVILLIFLLSWLAFYRKLNARRIPDLLSVAVGGIFGLILLLLLPKAD